GSEPEEEDDPSGSGAAPERLIRRAYSVSSGSQVQEYVEFYITLVGSGQLTPRLFGLQTGARLFMSPKSTGVFTLERIPEGSHILLIATGTGLAPYMSMVRTLPGQAYSRMAIVHGARCSWDLGYRAELQSLSRVRNDFNYIAAISNPMADPSWVGPTGRLDAVLTRPEVLEKIGFPLEPRTSHAFICGHPGMVESVTSLLEDKGFVRGSRKEPGNLHVEKYW
ncbi:MAG: ferredoxin--NADP reductase, partial [Magnetococcales bacterium]|nr:ferredoxin--NADP reductase [Magnetococcales bacterium]